MIRKFAGVLSFASACLILLAISGPTFGADQASSVKESERLLTVGAIGPAAIDLAVWTNQPSAHKFKAGDRVIIYFKADRDCYVTALNVSTQGDVSVLFPTREHPDNFVKAGDQYSLFGDDSSVRLVMGKGIPEVKMVFYVTSQRVALDPLKIPEDKPVLQIPGRDKESMLIIADKLEKASLVQGFNRLIVDIKSENEEGPGLKLMGPLKSVPSDAKSERPESLTGVQGVKPETER
jgi:hypothetical protein